MDCEADQPKTLSMRHKCSACFKQYKKKEHLVDHMRSSYHSVHQPKCGVCQKHCKTFASLREHLAGPLAKGNCSKVFVERGCSLCLNLFDGLASLIEHLQSCKLPAPSPVEMRCPESESDTSTDRSIDQTEVAPDYAMGIPCAGTASDTSSPMEGDYGKGSEVINKDSEVVDGGIGWLTEEMCSMGHSADISPPDDEGCEKVPEAVAIDCEMVGGGSDGSLDICARVGLIDEDENLIFHTYVEPYIPVTDYRYDITGVTEEHLEDAMPLKEVREKILQILYNGDSITRVRFGGGKARLLVGHNVEYDLDCLKMSYPDHLFRDTAKYRPLMKTNLVSHSLKHLTQTYLGYEIQSGVHDPFVDCVSVMRLYKRMRDQDHRDEDLGTLVAPQYKPNWMINNFDAFKHEELKCMTPDELFQISRSNYRCWCLDRTRPSSIISLEEREMPVHKPWPAWPLKGLS